MEEILASIRRIISEDGEEATAAASTKGADEASAEDPADEDDVLELTEVIEEVEEEPPAEEPEPVEAEAEPEIAEPEEEPPVAEVAEEPEPPEEPEPEPEAIISEAPAAQAADAIAGLMARVQSSTQLGNADLTIEQLTKELLRPLLKEWLDANLPGMVENIVREEIERVVAKSSRPR